MKTAHLIVVGKLRDKSLQNIENDYLKRLATPKLKIHELKAKSEDNKLEGELVLKKVQDISKEGSTHTVLLTEFGKEFESPDFSEWIYQKYENFKNVIFIIAGACGPSEELKLASDSKLSLSKLTFPHMVARVILIEQLYRAQTIKNKHPYHN